MRIVVAGAGAGKTTKMATRILADSIPAGKVVFCIAFTNAAAANIRSKLIEQEGSIPDNIKVSTIHSFLYTEFVHPYYHLLYGTRFKRISTIHLPTQPSYRRKRIRELEDMQLLHQTVIPEKAKWVVYKSSKDTAQIKAMRAKIIAMFTSYCQKIIVDEAQDIDKDIREALVALDKAGVDVELCGDPKQDVKGYGCFRELIGKHADDVTYSSECHRCPQLHLQVSNRLADEREMQVADATNSPGSLDVLFESDVDVATLVAGGGFGLAYISKKNERFDTHASHVDDGRFNTLFHYLVTAIRAKHDVDMTDLEIKRAAFQLTEQMIGSVDKGGKVGVAINKGIASGWFDYDRAMYAQMAESLKVTVPAESTIVTVKSIEAIKGLEDERCLFILTTDLAPYLLLDRTDDNRTRHLLYVALTRSLDNLTVLVTKEVESRYPRERIIEAFGLTSSYPASSPAGL